MTSLLAIGGAPRRAQSYPRLVLPVAFALFVALGIQDNVALALLSVVTLCVGTYLLWRPGESPILLFLFLSHWLQASIYIYYANFSGQPLETLSSFTTGLGETIVLCLFGVLFLAVGMRLGAGPSRPDLLQRGRSLLTAVPQKTWFLVYAAAWIAAALLRIFAATIPGLSQPLLALADLKWSAYFLLTVATFGRRDASKLLWLSVFGFEFASSLGGFFSSFKHVFIFSVLGLVAAGERLNASRIMLLAVLGPTAIACGLYWTAVKSEYRSFVSQGAAQTVMVEREEAVAKLIDLVSNVSSDQLRLASRQFISRLAEIDIFGAAIDHVPRYKDHANGAIWADAFLRLFMPRFLFPGKAIIDESQLTNEYTGLGVAGFEQGAQISMGFYADSYIDFGPYGMMLALLMFGSFIGFGYRWLVQHPSAHGLIGFALASAVLLRIESLGVSSAKIVSGLAVSMIVCALLLRYVVPVFLQRQMASKGHQTVRLAAANPKASG